MLETANAELTMMQAGPIITPFEVEVLYTVVPQLLDALHDAIRRPMGVVPESAEPFVTDKELEAAEARRPRQFDSEPEGSDP
jgi:hypothetical protein